MRVALPWDQGASSSRDHITAHSQSLGELRLRQVFSGDLDAFPKTLSFESPFLRDPPPPRQYRLPGARRFLLFSNSNPPESLRWATDTDAFNWIRNQGWVVLFLSEFVWHNETNSHVGTTSVVRGVALSGDGGRRSPLFYLGLGLPFLKYPELPRPFSLFLALFHTGDFIRTTLRARSQIQTSAIRSELRVVERLSTNLRALCTPSRRIEI